MRIIAGKFKGRRFYPPADKWPTRPTTDFAKESLFNILNNRIDFEEVSVLDLFGGTGTHSYEFISRGCKDVTYVDKFPACVQFVKKIAGELGISANIRIVKADVFKFVKTAFKRYDYIFADPPYDLPALDQLPGLIFQHGLLQPGGIFVLEHGSGHRFQQHPNFLEERHYGNTHFSFFENPDNE
jgi:16S rRNA (guanine(966)-N(2))-methyltransferase RsmD